MIEPLHDFKNIINRVLGELPYVARDAPQLQAKIDKALTALDGEHNNCLVSRKKVRICTDIFIDSKTDTRLCHEGIMIV